MSKKLLYKNGKKRDTLNQVFFTHFVIFFYPLDTRKKIVLAGSMKKVLVIRFSSFGDIIQSFSGVNFLMRLEGESEIHFLTKKEFAPLLSMHPAIKACWRYDRRSGVVGLWRLTKRLVAMDYDLIYDAHSTLRSKILKLFFILQRPPQTLFWISRPKNRWRRFKFFYLKKRDEFVLPFKGALSYVAPLKVLDEQLAFNFSEYVSWSFTKQMEADLFERFLEKILPEQHFITLAPSAAWKMKRWPVENWKRLVELLPNYQFLILGGPQDSFCQEIADVAPLRVINSAGKVSLLESCCLVFLSEFVISGDTGILHVADLFNIDGLALIGPTAFGHPSGERMRVLEVDLPCKPCTKDGRGRCKSTIYQECMVAITPEQVAQEVELFFASVTTPSRRSARPPIV